MPGFVANESETTPEAAITNNGFFPDIDPADFRASIRQDKTVTSARLRECLRIAMASANRDLAAWQSAREDEDIDRLQDVQAATIDGESVLLQHYRRAVYCLAKAELLERYQDFDATNSATQQALTQDGEQDNYRRDARWAISDLQGRPRTTVELI